MEYIELRHMVDNTILDPAVSDHVGVALRRAARAGRVEEGSRGSDVEVASAQGSRVEEGNRGRRRRGGRAAPGRAGPGGQRRRGGHWGERLVASARASGEGSQRNRGGRQGERWSLARGSGGGELGRRPEVDRWRVAAVLSGTWRHRAVARGCGGCGGGELGHVATGATP
jgi:hypothetical protein